MKILVSGTAGFIGFHLARTLLERGDEVVGIDNINDYYDVELKYARLDELGIERSAIAEGETTASKRYERHRFCKLDLADTAAMEALFKRERFDAVCHLAAQAGVRYSLENPHAYVQSNVVGFLNVLEGCRHHAIKNLVYASSSSVYGLNESQPFRTQDRTDHPVSLYAATKKSDEMLAHAYSHLYGIPTTGLRFFTVYGPYGRPDMAPMLFADAITEGRELKVFNHGQMSRDFTYIDDIVEGCVKVIDAPAQPDPAWDPNDPATDRSSAPYRLYNIGHNSPTRLLDFIETLERHLGRTGAKTMMQMQPGDVVSTYADVSGLIDDFGYAPRTTLDEGIGRFVEWYRQFYAKGTA